MVDTYISEIGKFKRISEQSNEYSEIRKRWFLAFEQMLRQEYPDLMQKVHMQIVGSVAKGLAHEESDIDIIIVTNSSNATIEHQVRQAIFTLLKKMRDEGKETFEIGVRDSGYSALFNNLNRFRFEHPSSPQK